MAAVDPDLTINIAPNSISDQGEQATLKLVATDGLGRVGTGQVTITSTAGDFKGGVAMPLDAYGTIVTPFTCTKAKDADCVGQVTISASWTVDGKTATATTKVTVTPPPPPPWEAGVTWDPGAGLTPCSGGTTVPPMACTNGMCRHGFSCVNNVCELNGGGGGLQYTLRFASEPVDLDLHVVEPDGKDPVSMMPAPCEIYYGNPNTTTAPSACGGRGSLDLDSNPSCALDNVDTENVIFPANNAKPAAGQYVARVDLWKACSMATPITFELEVRAGGAHRYYCGTFMPGDADMASAGGGRTISTITVPP
jgi:hypothetical protein